MAHKQLNCHNAIPGIDDKIAEGNPYFKSLGYNKDMVAATRALYDYTMSEPLIPEGDEAAELDLDKLGEKLASFTYATVQKEAQKAMTSLDTTFSTLAEAWGNAAELKQAASRVAIQVVEFAKQQKDLYNSTSTVRKLSTDEVLRGVSNPKTGVTVGGEKALFQDTFAHFLKMRMNLEENPQDTNYLVKKTELDNMLANWGALSVYARLLLKEREGISFAAKHDKVHIESFDDLVDNSIQEFDPEQSHKEAYQERKDKQSAFSTLTPRIKSVLSVMPQYSDSKGHIMKDSLGYDIYYSPSFLYNNLLNACRGIYSQKSMLEAIKWAVDHADNTSLSITYQNILQMLENDQTLMTQMYCALQKGFTTYSEISIAGKKRASYILNAGYSSGESVYLNKLLTGFPKNKKTGLFPQFFQELDGQLILNKAALHTFKSDNIFLRTDPKDIVKKTRTKAGLFEVSTEIKDALIPWGIDITDSDIFHLKKTGQLSKLITSVLALYSDDMRKYTDSISLSGTTPSFYTQYTQGEDNQLRKEFQKLFRLIDSSRQDQKYSRRAKIKDRHGKDTTVFSTQEPCFFTDLLDPIITMSNELGSADTINDYLFSLYGNSNLYDATTNTWKVQWLNDLSATNNAFASNLAHSRLAQVKVGKDIIRFEEISSKEHALALWTAFFQQKKDGTQKFAQYPIFILGDSGVARMITAPIYTYNNIVDGLAQLLQNDYRMYESLKALDKSYKEQGRPEGFELFNSFGFPIASAMLKVKDGNTTRSATKEEVIQMMENYSEEQLKDAIKKSLEAAVTEYKNRLSNMGLLTVNREGVYTELGKINGQKGLVNVTDANLQDAIHQYVTNTMFATANQFALFTVSTGFYKSIEDLQKRFKEIHASGTSLNPHDPIFRNRPYETCMYFNEITTNSEQSNPKFFEIAKKKIKDKSIYDDYLKNKLTDGQAYRTIDSYRRIAIAQGRWDKNGIEELFYKTLLNYRAGKVSKEKLFQVAEKAKVIFQPQKPYTFCFEKISLPTAENPNNTVLIPVQHKCAEVILIPELIADDTPLKHIAETMVDQDIDVLMSTEVVKVGNWGATSLGEATGSKAEIRAAMSKGVRHMISLTGYKRQQNVPEHVYDSRNMGTQMRKMFFFALNPSGKYSHYLPEDIKEIIIREGASLDFNGNSEGRKLAAYFNSLIESNIIESFHAFLDAISDNKKLSRKMQQILVNSSETSFFDLYSYSITGDDKFLVPFFDACGEIGTTARLLSIFKKTVTQQKMCGGSAVQASAFGVLKKEYDKKVDDGGLQMIFSEDGENIIGMQCELMWNMKYLDSHGVEKELEYDTYVNEDGSLKMSEDGTTSLLEKHFPGSTTLLAYRIPTESPYSALKLHVKRFTRPASGGIIKVPAECTTIAGFDFKQYWSH